jgi:hypothetical protein
VLRRRGADSGLVDFFVAAGREYVALVRRRGRRDAAGDQAAGRFFLRLVGAAKALYAARRAFLWNK